ncbi:aspartate carbamoyltransferase, partial [Vibrio parahaemolyticus EKP-028]
HKLCLTSTPSRKRKVA